MTYATEERTSPTPYCEVYKKRHAFPILTGGKTARLRAEKDKEREENPKEFTKT